MFERTRQGAVDILRGDLALNADSVPRVQDLFAQCCHAGVPRIVFDLEQIPLIDSAGLEWLLAAQDELQKRGSSLRLAVGNSLCREILHLTGVDESFEIYNNPSLAVSSFVQ